MSLKQLLKDDKAQIGGVITFFLLLFIAAFFYILLGGIMGEYVSANNKQIDFSQAGGSSIPYSQDHKDAMSSIFNYWYIMPIFIVILAILYAIKNGTKKDTGEI